MRWDNRDTRPPLARRRGTYSLKCEALEGRLLMATDLGANTPPTLPNLATAQYGILMAGGTSVGGAGFSVADIGDVTNDGYDDFLISAPTVVNANNQITLGTSQNSTVYLVFGSRTSSPGAISNWLNNNAEQRVGDLNQLNNSPAGQQNPVDGINGFPFAGLKFVTGQTPGSQLGASVSAVTTLHGSSAFLIGAPGETNSAGGNPGTGRAYLIYGGAGLVNAANNTIGSTIDLDNPLQNSGVAIVTFVGNVAGQNIGRAVSDAGDFLGTTNTDIAIGAPLAGVNGQGRSGGVYVISGASIPTTTATINLSLTDQLNGPAGVIFTGASGGDQAGFSLASAGDVDGALSPINRQQNDLLIGSPQQGTGPGAAYLVYGSGTLISQAIAANGVPQISLARVGSTAAGAVSGFRVNGTATNDQTGYSVSSAGDANGDGLSDILIGSPGYLSNTGRADIFYGQSLGVAPLTGTVTLGAATNTFASTTFTGTTPGDLAGYAVGFTGKINQTLTGNPYLIGAPGYNLGAGTVLLVPPNPALTGTYTLNTATSQPVAATQFTLTSPSFTTPSFFGASVSGRTIALGQRFTADGDLLADFIVGAPGYTPVTARGLDGGAFILEGARIAGLLQTPTPTSITTTIGVGAPIGPFTNINPTTPATLAIYVFSNATSNPPFDPVLDINPATIRVNGVAYPNATIAKDPVDENGDGIEDAIVTITPRANLGLLPTTTSLTITGQTLATSPNPNKTFSGTAAITVAGSTPINGGGGGGGTTIPIQLGAIRLTSFNAPFGPDRYVPTVAALSTLSSYKPIPLAVALRQFGAQPGFNARLRQFYFPTSHFRQFGNPQEPHTGHGRFQLGYAVFTREKFKPGRSFTFTHRVPVVPVNLQRERLR